MTNKIGDVALVTGGAGFIGSALSTYLLEHFNRVIAFDNLLPQVHPSGKPAACFNPDVEIYREDIRSSDAWDRLLSSCKPDLVVHLAAETGTGQSLTSSTRHTSVNVVGTSTMLDAFTRHRQTPNRFLLCSSRAVYGEGAWQYVDGPDKGKVFYPGLRSRAMLESHQWDFPHAKPLPMNASSTERRPESIYGVTKSAQEDLLTLWCDAFESSLVILRLQNVYGVGQTPENPYTGIMSIFSKIAQRGGSIPLYEDGQVRRDFVYIDDVKDACIRAIELEQAPNKPIDIGSGRYTTIAEAARIISDHYHADKPCVTGEWRHGDVRHAWSDTSQAEQILNFQANEDIKSGLKKLMGWIDSL